MMLSMELEGKIFMTDLSMQQSLTRTRALEVVERARVVKISLLVKFHTVLIQLWQLEKGGKAARKEAPYASVAAAPNTIAYTEKYGGEHDRPGNSDESSTESYRDED